VRMSINGIENQVPDPDGDGVVTISTAPFLSSPTLADIDLSK
jgi:hypothetical protein